MHADFARTFINVPPLRERKDIPYLAERLLARIAGRLGKPTPNLTAQDRKLLLGYAWPGNVRELENALTRMIVTGTLSIYVTAPSSTPTQPDAPTPLKGGIRSQTGAEIGSALKRTQGSRVSNSVISKEVVPCSAASMFSRV